MIILDEQFGEVLVRQSRLASGVRFSVTPAGRLALSVPSGTSNFLVKRFINGSREQIAAQLPLRDPATQRARDAQKKLLMKQARQELPYRLAYLAQKYGYRYVRHRLSHAGTRWGSCSSTGTISLNIALVRVPGVLRDYVLLHELAHTLYMDHSAGFWGEVSRRDPLYKEHRRELKKYSPAL